MAMTIKERIAQLPGYVSNEDYRDLLYSERKVTFRGMFAYAP